MNKISAVIKKNMLQEIKLNNGFTRNEISAHMHLRFPTVAKFTQALVNEGWIIESDAQDSSGFAD